MLDRTREMEKQLIEWRRDFHMHPELGFQEERTAAKVAAILEDLGYRVRTGVGRTGVVAELGEGQPVIGIRADMDALPIQEANDVPYASQVPGVMHACGHDAHTAIALGVATLLAQETFPGTVRFLFQPAEETGDEEGISGAPRMVEDGALEKVDAVIALHVDTTTPTGDIKVEAGPASAGVDTFYAKIIGSGGHGAYPHRVVDPIHISGHVILALHGIVSRKLHPRDPAVVSIGSIHGGEADNVIPDHVDLCGTIRFTQPEVQEQIHAEIKRALELARSLGGDYELRIEIGYPPMNNDAKIVNLIRNVAVDLLGANHIQEAKLEMGAEDFGFFSSSVPGAMFALGCQIEGDERKAHSVHFDIDERCLPIGVAILAESALRLLGGGIHSSDIPPAKA
ncbi:MAG: peptidase M20 [Anaerolineae bacterium SM23_ 63]|nr:MAG: peptidase M20 [Anaerolineae bacterium SM23_ 63]HEY47081.1 amidohydrolase [Anaerolineae bacterium]